MANQEQLDILIQGVQVWNQWRDEHTEIIPDLNGANLSQARLETVNFFGANLEKASLSQAHLERANLELAHLLETDLSQAHLERSYLDMAFLLEANLSGAYLEGADLSEAVLADADLSQAHLENVDLRRAYLEGADLSQTYMRDTILGDVDLSKVRGLDTVNHHGPSTIGIDTLIRSQGKIPEIFLRGAGVQDSIIEAIPSLIGSLSPFDYYSCFISYSSKDDAFARRLHADLQSNHVRCWFAPEDLKWGERIRTGIDEAMHLHDKLLLILSKSSVASGWVEREVKTVLARERKEKRTILFPIRVDRAVFESPFDWATEIRHERNIGDFTRWKQHDEYQKALNRLLRDLQGAPQKMNS